jgi:hypothetical protein
VFALNKEEFYRMDEIVSLLPSKKDKHLKPTSSHQMKLVGYQELLSTDTLKKGYLSHKGLLIFPRVREIQKNGETRKPPTNS